MAKRPMGHYKPIYVSNLVVDNTHTGRILRGRVIVPVLVMSSAMTLLEDETGAVVKVSVYNALPPGLEGPPKLAAAKAYLKEGTLLAVLDPYYKTAMDGSRIIRVDDPSDIVFVDDVGPKSAIDLRVEVSSPSHGRGTGHVCLHSPVTLMQPQPSQGNNLFKAKIFDHAAQLYTRALQVVDDGRLLSSILCNTATALMQASPDDPHHDLVKVYATTAVTVDPTYVKAGLRRGAAFGTDPLAKRSAQLGVDMDVVLAVSSALGRCLGRLVAQSREPPSSGEAQLSASDLKARGNERFKEGAFREGAFDDAVRLYVLAVAALDTAHSVALILSNRSVCYLQLDQPAAALANAIATICCAPALAKGHVRRAAALLHMGKWPEAHAAVEDGLALNPADVPLKELQKQIADAARADAVSVGRGGDYVLKDRLKKLHQSGNYVSERVFKREENEDAMGASSLSNMNGMIQMCASMAKARGKSLPTGFCLDERVPPFHTEFSTRGLWPAACDVSACQEKLVVAYENARAAAFHLSALVMDRDMVTPDKYLIKRLGSNCSRILDWYSGASSGDVNTNPLIGIYDPRQLHTYSNAVNRKEMMTRGTCSVSIGFVDLAFLREADFDSLDNGTGVTRWVGYEASPYCVAKSIVIATMLLQRAPVDAVLQVWYSAPI